MLFLCFLEEDFKLALLRVQTIKVVAGLELSWAQELGEDGVQGGSKQGVEHGEFLGQIALQSVAVEIHELRSGLESLEHVVL